MISDIGAKNKILVADDSEMNRELLTEMLEDEFEIIEAENGEQAVAYMQDHASEISLLLLDIVMPEMDGFEVLAYMNKYHWINQIPVIMISSETAPHYIERAYELGASDFINRPFNMAIVRRRVTNTIALYTKQRRLIGLVADQIIEREKSNSMMITILSHIVEFRNGESGLHVLHVQTLTDLFLQKLAEKAPQYGLSQADISLISLASALHDIGKISVPSEVLNKPGRFTPEEFEIMKKHSEVGADMLRDLPIYQDEPLVKVAYEICRWHHERWDGRGYPDGLKGEEIPISAQVVALADVYDALTSERCYKDAIPHEKAIEMILNGECGAFNPLLMECLAESQEEVRMVHDLGYRSKREVTVIADDILNREDLTIAERLQQQLDTERARFQFLADTSADIVFAYTGEPPTLTLNERGAAMLGLAHTVMNPLARLDTTGEHAVINQIADAARGTSWREPFAELLCPIMLEGRARPCRVILRSIWTSGAQSIGIVGRIIPED